MPSTPCAPTTRSFSFIVVATSTRPSSRATSASTLTAAVPPACSIISTPNVATAPTSLPIVRRSPATWLRSNKCAKPWERGTCHEILWAQISSRQSGDISGGLHHRRLWQRHRRTGIQDDFLHGERVRQGYRPTIHGSSGSVSAHPSGFGRENAFAAGFAPYGVGCLQPIQDYACLFSHR